MRWANPVEKDDSILAWSHYPNEPRLSSTKKDFEHFSMATGIKRIIHGHTHPHAGYESLYNGKVIAVNSTRCTGGSACVLMMSPGKAAEKMEIQAK